MAAGKHRRPRRRRFEQFVIDKLTADEWGRNVNSLACTRCGVWVHDPRIHVNACPAVAVIG